MYQRALEINPDDSVTWNNIGNVRLDQHKYRAAIRAYAYALRINPRYANAWSGWGATLTKLKRFKEAETCLRRAVELDPAGSGRINMARLLRAQSRLDEAIAAVSPATNEKIIAPDAFAIWGDILVEKRDFAGAAEKYAEADRCNPQRAIGHAGRANTL